MDVIVAGTPGTVAGVVLVSTDKIPIVAVLAVALIARRWPRLGHTWTERGQEGTDDHDGLRRGQQIQPYWAEFVTSSRRSHCSAENCHHVITDDYEPLFSNLDLIWEITVQLT